MCNRRQLHAIEKIVAYLDFHGCLLRGARPNRILNRYNRKREGDRRQSAFCVPINHFLLLPIQRADRRVAPILDHPHHMGQRAGCPASRMPDRTTPERCVEAYYLQRTRFETIAEREIRRRQLTEDGNVEISGRDLR